MFRFAVAAGCAQLVAGARTKEVNGELSLDDIQNNQHDTLSAVENSQSTTYCPYASGFTAHEGKCTGQFVENWANGEYANYGQDSNGHIHGLADTAHRCMQHRDCSGFYTREGVGYSHWRTGRFAVNPNPGHCCYRKVGGGSNLLEVSESEDADAEGAIVATQDEAQPQRCDAGRTCPTYDHCHPVSYGAYGCGFQCTRQGGHGSYLCNNHCAGCNYVSLLELSPSLLDMSASENVDASDSLAKHAETNTYCPHVNGFSATTGKCIGQFIDNFENGDYAYYGQDANGGISSVGDAAHRCSQHWDCVGFYTREGVGYSHYRSSISHVASGYPGHCCYQRSGYSLAELSAENEESKEEASGSLANHDEATYDFAVRNTIANAVNGKRLFAQDWCCSSSDSGWAAGVGATTAYAAEPPRDQQWMIEEYGEGQYWITNVDSDRLLLVTNDGVIAAKPGATGYNALWTFDRSGGAYTISNSQTGCRLFSNPASEVACLSANTILYEDQKWNIARAYSR